MCGRKSFQVRYKFTTQTTNMNYHNFVYGKRMLAAAAAGSCSSCPTAENIKRKHQTSRSQVKRLWPWRCVHQLIKWLDRCCISASNACKMAQSIKKFVKLRPVQYRARIISVLLPHAKASIDAVEWEYYFVFLGIIVSVVCPMNGLWFSNSSHT